MTRATVSKAPVVVKLEALAKEFDATGDYYARFAGEHNDLLRRESKRSARQLRAVAEQVQYRGYTEAYGAYWLKAGWRIIVAIGRGHIV